MAAQTKSSPAHVVVELASAATALTRAALRASGIEIQDWIDGTRYYAALDARGVAATAGTRPALDGIAIYDLTPADKISSYLSGPASAKWASAEWQGRPAVDVAVLLFPDVSVDDALSQARSQGWGVLGESAWQHRITLRIARDELSQLAALDFVRHIQPTPPAPVQFDNFWSAQLMEADKVNTGSGSVTGKGVKVGMWDGGTVASLPDFTGRLKFLEQPFSDAHATHVAGTLAGDGSTEQALRGIAPGALLFSGTFYGDVFEKMRLAVASSGVQISQNSWGEAIYESLGNCEMYGEYTQEERLVDALTVNQNLSVVFAMGNPRDSGECALSARAGYYSAGIPASAKNAIAVAAASRQSDISTFSGFGPTRDGRLKPDVTALGVDVRSLAVGGSLTASGTSMAAPAISGMLALLVERLQARQGDSQPKASLLKAILLNSARDVGNPGPDYVFGYGIPNAPAAIAAVDENRYLVNRISSGSANHTITVPGGAGTLRVMLVWSDAPGSPESSTSLVNDLDLSLSHAGDPVALPLTLNPRNPAADAQPAVNRRDNVEQVVIQNPPAGDFTAVVSAFRMGGAEQEYALTWTFESVPVPPCTITIDNSVLTAAETGGTLPVVLTQSNQCPPGEIENPSGWVQTSVPGPLRGSSVVKMRLDPNQTSGSRSTMLRLAGKELRINQSGPCIVETLPSSLEVRKYLGIMDCIYYGSHAKLFTFDAKAGQTVSIQMESADFDTYLELLGPNLNVVAYDDDSIGKTDSRIPGPTGRLTLPYSGTYTIVATSYALHEGTFVMKVEFGGPQDPPPADVFPRQITGCPFTAPGQLTDSSSADGRRGALYRTQAYALQAFAGQRLDISVSEADFDSFVYLISPTGGILATNDDDAAGTGSRITETLPLGGTWRIEVTSFAPFITGNYQLQVMGCPPVAK
ncbi:S8 family serine peptidase [Paludibaculum fermentans]|uniref:S8 family serine peptidase n=1 Tax=Paludibaculum fermentans TaxID=1473598 RepID=A0A7S7NNZ2_PALFE|nr:S8 family serine peptidase [Paludibaculum fermentans]QOY87064.1 S8 family serine peptidase [Paludibaculum fermentans]